MLSVMSASEAARVIRTGERALFRPFIHSFNHSFIQSNAAHRLKLHHHRSEVPLPTAASAALRAAVHAALTADAALIAALGGPKIYDEPPREAAFPYVTLGETRIADFSAGGEPALEHQLTLHAWSRQGGQLEAHVIAGALLQALDEAPLALAGHRLVNFRFATADVRRESDGRTYRALVRFRAVTEPE
jgi:hypothetical protein